MEWRLPSSYWIWFSQPISEIKEVENLPNQLSNDQKIWLLDPKTYGEMLEWHVEACVLRKPITRKLVLCLNNEPSTIKDQHEDVLDSDWDPTGKHLDLVMKVYPDDYGVDFIRVTKLPNGTIQLYLSQIRLGGSQMIEGKITTDQNGKQKAKSDTVNHMLMRFKNSEFIKKCLEAKLPLNATVEVQANACFTQKLSAQCQQLIESEKITLFNRQAMLTKIWDDATVSYAKDTQIDWIVNV